MTPASSSSPRAAPRNRCTPPSCSSWSWAYARARYSVSPGNWSNLDAAELYVGEQVQRVGNELLRRQVKTETSQAPLPLPELCVAALKLRYDQQEADRTRAAGGWVDTGLVFTTRHGTAMEPRNFSRSFDRCIGKAQVPRITVHGTRKTCGSLWPPWTCTLV